MTIPATKTPAEIKDYEINWSAELDTDTISASAWSVSPGDVTVSHSSVDTSNTLATVWLSGGTIGITYYVTNTINTAGGRELTKTFRLNVTNNNYL